MRMKNVSTRRLTFGDLTVEPGKTFDVKDIPESGYNLRALEKGGFVEAVGVKQEPDSKEQDNGH